MRADQMATNRLYLWTIGLLGVVNRVAKHSGLLSRGNEYRTDFKPGRGLRGGEKRTRKGRRVAVDWISGAQRPTSPVLV